MPDEIGCGILYFGNELLISLVTQVLGGIHQKNDRDAGRAFRGGKTVFGNVTEPVINRISLVEVTARDSTEKQVAIGAIRNRGFDVEIF